MIFPPRGLLLFGASGQLGAAIRKISLNGTFVSKIWTVSWDLARKGEFRIPDGPCDLIFANGLTDPKAGEPELRFSNYEFPRDVIKDGLKNPDLRFMTIGSVLEKLVESTSENHYLLFKKRLAEWVQDASIDPKNQGRLLHLRIHTLYGGVPKSHLFLGQMAEALKNGSTFRMSSGEQLREYHHAEDVARSIQSLLTREWNFGSISELNSGQPIRLIDLAREIFKAFGREKLLEVGSISRPALEERTRPFQRSESWMLPSTREPIAGVIESLRESLRVNLRLK